MKTTPYALILLTWNQWELTEKCLRSLRGLSEEAWTLWVVDNGSSEKPPADFEKCHLALQLIRLPENLGFAGGCNRGAQAALKAGTEVLLFLNNDAVVSPDEINRLARAVREGPYRILGGVNYRPSEPDRIFSTGQKFLWPLCRLKRLRDLRGANAPQPVAGIIGACFAVHRELFERIGFFDERFFIYYEEADLCLRAASAGLPVACHPQVKIWHEGCSSFGKISPATLYLYTRNLGLFVMKHCPKPFLPFCLFSYAAQVALKLVAFFVKGERLKAKAVWVGMIDFLQGRFGKGRLDLFLKG